MADNAWTPEIVEAQRQKVLKRPLPASSAPRQATIAPKVSKRAKFGNKPVMVAFKDLEYVSGHQRLVHTFDSGREAERYKELVLMRLAGEITALRLQEPFLMLAHGPDAKPVPFGEWFADFVYQDLKLGRRVVEDVKSSDEDKITKTAMYKLKKKVIQACHAITIEEV